MEAVVALIAGVAIAAPLAACALCAWLWRRIVTPPPRAVYARGKATALPRSVADRRRARIRGINDRRVRARLGLA